MTVMVHQSAAEARTNAAFDALLWALSRPGLSRDLPETGETAEALIVEALLDRECRVYAAEPTLIPVIMRTGAQIAEIEQADHVFLGALTSSEALSRVTLGSDVYPDDGATLMLRGTFGTGQNLRLSGPGIDGTLVVTIGGLPDGFWQRRAELMRYPMGFDMFVLDGTRVVGIPRSTQVEVL